MILPGAVVPTSSGNMSTSTVTLIDTRSGPVLVDCAAWNQRRALLSELQDRSLTPGDIVAVVFTHLHWDHCMNFDLFPGSKLMIPAAEWRRLQEPGLDSATPSFLWSLLEGLENVVLFEPGPVFEQTVAIPTPGHTRGHVALVIDNGERVVIAGDAVPTKHAARVGVPHLVFGEEAEARASVAKVLAAGEVVIPGHDYPFRGRLDDLVFGMPQASKEGMV